MRGWLRNQRRGLELLQAHLPLGEAWRAFRLPGKVAHGLASAIGALLDDAAETMARLVAELDPYTTTDLLPEWEHALSLPDPCLPPVTSLDERRQRLIFRLSRRRWTTIEDWYDLADLFGLTIRITPGWYVQAPALYPMCYPVRYDLFPRLGRFRVYIDIDDVSFAGYDYGGTSDNAGEGYPVPYGPGSTIADNFICLIDRVRPANVVVVWNAGVEANGLTCNKG